MRKSLAGQRLLALFAAGWVLLDAPLLMLWDRADASVFGLPLLPVALFVQWGVLITLAGRVAERAED